MQNNIAATRRALIVEDDRLTAETLQRVLRLAEYEPEICATLPDAESRLHDLRDGDVVSVDSQLPGKDGNSDSTAGVVVSLQVRALGKRIQIYWHSDLELPQPLEELGVIPVRDPQREMELAYEFRGNGHIAQEQITAWCRHALQHLQANQSAPPLRPLWKLKLIGDAVRILRAACEPKPFRNDLGRIHPEQMEGLLEHLPPIDWELLEHDLLPSWGNAVLSEHGASSETSLANWIKWLSFDSRCATRLQRTGQLKSLSVSFVTAAGIGTVPDYGDVERMAYEYSLAIVRHFIRRLANPAAEATDASHKQRSLLTLTAAAGEALTVLLAAHGYQPLNEPLGQILDIEHVAWKSIDFYFGEWNNTIHGHLNPNLKVLEQITEACDGLAERIRERLEHRAAALQTIDWVHDAELLEGFHQRWQPWLTATLAVSMPTWTLSDCITQDLRRSVDELRQATTEAKNGIRSTATMDVFAETQPLFDRLLAAWQQLAVTIETLRETIR